LELKTGRVEKIELIEDLSIIAVIGQNMRHTPGISGKFFRSLGINRINIVAIAQESSELNITAVVQKQDERKALQVLHDNFFFSHIKKLNVFLVGAGNVGGVLLKQIRRQQKILFKKHNYDLRIVAIGTLKGMIFNKEGIDLTQWGKLLLKEKQEINVKEFVKQMKAMNLINSVFVDCTASEEIALQYEGILKNGISVVTPNKKLTSHAYKTYKKIKKITALNKTVFFYETNVGAGLPVIGPLQNLIMSGDEVLKIEGVFSGTLSFIFNNYTGSKKFSEIVKEAKDKGYTEPDPRDDLNGMDVARKLLILAREIGLKLELKDIKVENLLSKECQKAKSVTEFFEVLKKSDSTYEKKKKAAEKKGKVLRYLAHFERGKAKVSLTAVDSQHPAFTLKGSDNLIVFKTRYYKDTPFVVKGPGAGPEVTAAGIFGDILKVVGKGQE
jgi:aspartokinase/homoserine dehydrogenase 1